MCRTTDHCMHLISPLCVFLRSVGIPAAWFTGRPVIGCWRQLSMRRLMIHQRPRWPADYVQFASDHSDCLNNHHSTWYFNDIVYRYTNGIYQYNIPMFPTHRRCPSITRSFCNLAVILPAPLCAGETWSQFGIWTTVTCLCCWTFATRAWKWFKWVQLYQRALLKFRV